VLGSFGLSHNNAKRHVWIYLNSDSLAALNSPLHTFTWEQGKDKQLSAAIQLPGFPVASSLSPRAMETQEIAAAARHFAAMARIVGPVSPRRLLFNQQTDSPRISSLTAVLLRSSSPSPAPLASRTPRPWRCGATPSTSTSTPPPFPPSVGQFAEFEQALCWLGAGFQVGVHHAIGVGPASAAGRPGRAAAAARPYLRGPRARGGGRRAHGRVARRAVPGRGAARKPRRG
jgi:hypothetical protein